jgi:cell division transport system permease protein
VDALRRAPLVTAVAVATVFVAVLVTGLFAATLGAGERLVAAWAGDVPISVYLAPGADLAAARSAAERIAPGRSVEPVTAAEALARLRASLGDEAGVLDGLGDDVLPASLEVRTSGLSLAGTRELAARLRDVPGAAEVDFGAAWLERLATLLSRARTVGVALLVAVALATAVLVSNTLRLAVYARRDEIEIMKLVGATDAHVGAPFVVEGAIQGLAGAALAVATLLGASGALLPRLRAALPLAARIGREDVLPGALVAALLAGGVALGVAASLLSLRRFLRRA